MATPRVTIDQLPMQASLEDTNELIVQDSGVTKKLSGLALRNTSSDALLAHINDPTDAHDASAISATPSAAGINGPDVQAQLGQLATLADAGVTQTEGDARYLQLAGGTVSGTLTTTSAIAATGGLTSAGPTVVPTPTLATQATTKGYVDAVDVLKADKTYVDAADALKADKSYVDAQDATKVDKTYVDAADSLKADTVYVDAQDATKADKARTITTVAPLIGGGDLSADRTLAISSAQTSNVGVIQLATQAEVNTGTNAVKAVVPSTLRTSSDARYLQLSGGTVTGPLTANFLTVPIASYFQGTPPDCSVAPTGSSHLTRRITSTPRWRDG